MLSLPSLLVFRGPTLVGPLNYPVGLTLIKLKIAVNGNFYV